MLNAYLLDFIFCGFHFQPQSIFSSGESVLCLTLFHFHEHYVQHVQVASSWNLADLAI